MVQHERDQRRYAPLIREFGFAKFHDGGRGQDPIV